MCECVCELQTHLKLKYLHTLEHCLHKNTKKKKKAKCKRKKKAQNERHQTKQTVGRGVYVCVYLGVECGVKEL